MKSGTHPLAPRNWPIWLGLGLLRLAVWLPYPLIMATGRVLGRWLYRLAGRRRRIACINLRLCFPDLDEAQREALLKRHFESSGQGVMELAMAWWMSPARLAPLVEWQGAEAVQGAFAQGRGVIFLSAHFSALELSGLVLNQVTNFRPMYRRHENAVVERFFRHKRQQRFGEPLPKEDVKGMLRTLKQNGGVWFAPDQSFAQKSRVLAPFFGHPAPCNPATSRFARLSGAVVLPYVVLRKPGNQGYLARFETPLTPFPTDDPVADATTLNRQIEAWVMQAPEQYFWMHRRFKRYQDGHEVVYTQ